MKFSFLRRVQAYVRFRKARAFLKKYSCVSWKQYNKRYDPDINKHEYSVKRFYKGYRYIFAPTDHNHYAYQLLYDYGPAGHRCGYHEMIDWCETNCSEKNRCDIHRVTRAKGFTYSEFNDTMTWSDTDDFVLNDLGGQDILFFAFKNEKDLLWFKLRWE